MRFSFLILAAICKLSALAVARGLVQNHTAENGIESRSTADPTGVVAWIGEVHPGQGNITLTGTDAFDILDQIEAMNPDYKAVENQPIRSHGNPFADFQALYCGNMGTAETEDAKTINFMLYLATHIKGEFIFPPQKCTRLGCKNTSGVYVCNDDMFEQRFPADFITRTVQGILQDCCMPANHAENLIDFTSGQAFHKAQKMSVAVAYANCNHAADADRPTNFPYPGVNGKCCMTCQWDSKNGHLYGGGFGHDGL